MASQIEPLPATPLVLPEGSDVVTVQAVDTTFKLYIRALSFLDPVIPGHEFWNANVMAFFITNQKTGKKILFDAGVRKDYWNGAPYTVARFASAKNVEGIKCEKGVDEILVDAGVKLEDLEAVVWSHWHFDHTGDPSVFPPNVNLVVGEGFKKNLLPGFPANPNSPILESDYEGRFLHEIEFDDNFKIGPFRAHDYFGDGSFYLLDVPGHAVGHICGLARTTPTTFTFLGADTCHFTGAIRPTPQVPMPASFDVATSGLDAHFANPCPCSIFTDCHPGHTEHEKRTEPYYTASRHATSAYAAPDVANQSIQGLKQFDSSEDVFICLAHDPSLSEVLPLINADKTNNINDWKAKGFKDTTRWMFLNELPRDGKPGREPIVDGFWRDGKKVSVPEALKREDGIILY